MENPGSGDPPVPCDSRLSGFAGLGRCYGPSSGRLPHHLTTAVFPRSERFGLRAQIRRAAVSVPSHIAEGQSRDSRPDFLGFVAIAAGSLAELRTQLVLAARVQYTGDTHEAQIEELARRLSALRGAIQRKEASRMQRRGGRGAPALAYLRLLLAKGPKRMLVSCQTSRW